VLLMLLAPELCAAQTASQRLDRLAAESYERALDLFPVAEIFGRGAGPRQDRFEITVSDEHRERQRAHNRWILSELEGIPLGELAPSEKITHALLAWRARDSLEWLSYPFYQHNVFSHLDGGVAHQLVRIVGQQPFRNEADYRAWLRRLQRYPAYLEAVEKVMRDGAATGITTPRVITQRALAQLERLAPEDMTQSALWKPMTQFPASIDADARSRLETDYRRLLAEETFPALRRLATYVGSDYVTKARTTDGFGALPGGEKMYRYAVRSSTTTDLSPEEIHELGLREVKRIQALYLAAAAKAGFSGSVSQARAWVQGKRDTYPFTGGEQVIEYLNGINARIVPQLPKLFSRLPKARLEIRLTDPAIAASAPAQYYSPTDDGSPGVFAMPVTDARRVSTVGLAALFAHEGLPGHHLEIGLKLENKVPEFRRRIGFNAYSEGWGLYAESLGHELGLYSDPLELMGRYSFELFRACRLVIDTGLHAKGWTREQAIRYMLDNSTLAESDVVSEVERYIAWPGQALGYKIGDLRIQGLRHEAERELGARFDVRDFHREVLSDGAVPMDVLERKIARWIDAHR